MRSDEELWSPDTHPGEILGVRRHTDRCFHAAEEEVEEGYIVQGVLFPRDEIVEVRITRRDLPPCPGSES